MVTLGGGHHSLTKPSGSKAVNALIDQILENVPETGDDAIRRWRQPENDIRRQVRRDYVRPLRKLFDLPLIEDLIASARRVWPKINLAPHHCPSSSSMTRLATEQQVQLQARPYSGAEGMALRGFYVDKRVQRKLRKPLIFVNTAHHPGAVAATFTHEMGHHLTTRLFGSRDKTVHFFFDASYDSHLNEPVELAADVIVAMLAYPAPVARRIFSRDWSRGLVAKVNSLEDSEFEQVRAHIAETTGFKIVTKMPAQTSFAYLAGMVHFAKLRAALLAEYDV
jgi:hypothetical protein